VKSLTKTFLELLSQVRSKLPNPAIRATLDEMEEQFFNREKLHEKQKQVDADPGFA